ncbi:MAG TPA: hypothetical protein VJ783_31230 [Pirellulales bacterium]|nr:hypothetical protein [Pirellulales bacterium]
MPKKPSKKRAKASLQSSLSTPIVEKLASLRRRFLESSQETGSAAADSLERESSRSTKSRKSAHEVIAEKMPGMRIVATAPISDRDVKQHASSQGTGLDALKRKYFGQAAGSGQTKNSDSESAEGDSELVLVEPAAADANRRGPGPKAVIISNGRIIGRQG